MLSYPVLTIVLRATADAADAHASGLDQDPVVSRTVTPARSRRSGEVDDTS